MLDNRTLFYKMCAYTEISSQKQILKGGKTFLNPAEFNARRSGKVTEMMSANWPR